MDNIPLHPVIVHVPLVLAVALPVVAVAILVGIRRRRLTPASWWLLTVITAVVALGSFAALRTGEQEEERVEGTVAEQPLEEHEERAQLFFWLSLAFTGVTATVPVLTRTRFRPLAQGMALAGAVALAIGAVGVGHSGGELVYRHGAANSLASSALHQDADERDEDGSGRRDHDERDEHE